MVEPAAGQTESANPDSRPDKFASSAMPTGPKNLLTDKYKVELWGIKAPEYDGFPLQLTTRKLLDELLYNSAVRCSVVSWRGDQALARCLNDGEVDLSLALLQEGYMISDREVIYNTVFAEPYFKAEEAAQKQNKGVWAYSSGGGGVSSPASLSGVMPLVAAVIGSSLAGFAILAFVCARGFKGIHALHKNQLAMLLSREENLREREKFVVASMLEAEISANKVKIEAFLVIYEEMLRNLKDPAKQQKYRLTGEIIQEQPRLVRSVYDGNVERMDLLGAQLASDIARYYSRINPNPGYITLEPDYPLEDAIYRVERVISEVTALVAPADRLISALQVILRDKKKKGLVSAPGE